MATSFKIVVADDEPDIREYFEKMLSRLGHQVVGAAQDGEELVDLCRLHKPDLVITDLKMPILDGCEASKRICEERPVPVILVSAHVDPNTLLCADSRHITGHLVKPIKRHDLANALIVAVERFEKSQFSQSKSNPESDES